MRTETDKFYKLEYDDDDGVRAEIALDDDINIITSIESEGCVKLTKKQASEFARKILEMCGEGEDD